MSSERHSTGHFGALIARVAIEEALRVDEGTSGVPGWPEITSTILQKIEQCEVFLADITPINGPESPFRLTPNPNVLFELGYALATGLGRIRIICVVNAAYLPGGDPKELPFDVRASRPVRFSLPASEARGVTKGQTDPVRATSRERLARDLEGAFGETLAAIQAQRANRMLGATPHLVTDSLQEFQVMIDLETAVPFQVDYLIKEPSGTLLSGFMMTPTPVDPKEMRRVRFPSTNLKPRAPGNDVYVLSGRIAHVPSGEQPVPEFHPFEVRYQAVGKTLNEIGRTHVPRH